MSSAAGNAGEKSSRLSKFHTVDIPTRMTHLQKAGFISPDTRAALEGGKRSEGQREGPLAHMASK